jgi:hypothetical protein
MNIKLYLTALADIGLILLATLAEIDLEIRIIAGVIGILIGVLTAIKFIQDISIKREDLRLKKMQRKEKEIDLEARIKKHYENY